MKHSIRTASIPILLAIVVWTLSGAPRVSAQFGGTNAGALKQQQKQERRALRQQQKAEKRSMKAARMSRAERRALKRQMKRDRRLLARGQREQTQNLKSRRAYHRRTGRGLSQ